jgi:hypothetical protein
LVLSSIAIVASSFHFYPFEKSKLWQIINPANFSIGFGVIIVLISFIFKETREEVIYFLPPVSVCAYLMINWLSMAFASEISRTLNFNVKLILLLFGGYILFNAALYNKKSIRFFYFFAVVSLTICLCTAQITRYVFYLDRFGFHNNPYKYGTFSGILVPLSAGYLISSTHKKYILLGSLFVVVGLSSASCFGALTAISGGMLTVLMAVKHKFRKAVILLSFGVGLFLLILNPLSRLHIREDLKATEKDQINLKQRYIEWQAEINLLGKRTITGTAAGCINDHRSKFYGRLPKLNTLKPFDQNGWLAVGSETGILGLMCFCWMVLYYIKIATKSLSQRSDAVRIGNLSGLVAACLGNLFSSVQYNGVLIAFVLVIALISGTKRVSRKP